MTKLGRNDRSTLTSLSASQRTDAVNAYNAVFGEMDRALWCLSQHCRAPLLEGRSARVIEELVWTVKVWWGIQGVERDAKARMGQALAAIPWSTEMFEEAPDISEAGAEFALVLVKLVVEKSQELGVPRRELSLASKVLHWLLPARISVYDNFVRESLGVSASVDPLSNYYRVASKIFQAMQDLAADDSAWLGTVEPRTPLRALDKCLWWLGGGSAGKAAVVSDPWRVVDRLGLRRS